MTLTELKQQIEELPPADRDQLIRWLVDEDDDWDRQFACDVAAGRLDKLADKALADHAAGRSLPL